MQFDLQKFYKTADKPQIIAFESDLSGMDFPGYSVPAPVGCTFRAAPTAEGVELELTAEATAVGECARCLAPAEEKCSFTRDWQFTGREIAGNETDLPVDEKGSVNLDELVYQEIMFEVSSVLLCSPDCQGLCPICGQKKAAGCSCQPAENAAPADARLSILKQLLN